MRNWCGAISRWKTLKSCCATCYAPASGGGRSTIDEIQRRVAEHFNIKLVEMTSSRRARIVARPRQVAMYLAKQLTQRSLPEIGRKFGGRDHTTVMHAVRKIEELTRSDRALAEDVDVLQRMLGS